MALGASDSGVRTVGYFVAAQARTGQFGNWHVGMGDLQTFTFKVKILSPNPAERAYQNLIIPINQKSEGTRALIMYAMVLNGDYCCRVESRASEVKKCC